MKREKPSKKNKEGFRRFFARLYVFLRDWGVPLLETAFLGIMTVLPLLFEIQMEVDDVSDAESVVWSCVSAAGKGWLCVAMFLFWLLAIRKYNENAVLNSTPVYHKHCLLYYYAAAFLGYKQCNLVGVPVYSQVQVVIRRLFEEYPTRREAEDQENEQVKVTYINEDAPQEKVNLIVADTYDINMAKGKTIQIPKDCRKLYTVKIEQSNTFGVRAHRPKLIKEVSKAVSKFPDGCEVNYFATTNPENQSDITQQVFMKFGRGNIGKLYVYQQSSEGARIFEDKVRIRGI